MALKIRVYQGVCFYLQNVREEISERLNVFLSLPPLALSDVCVHVTRAPPFTCQLGSHIHPLAVRWQYSCMSCFLPKHLGSTDVQHLLLFCRSLEAQGPQRVGRRSDEVFLQGRQWADVKLCALPLCFYKGLGVSAA